MSDSRRRYNAVKTKLSHELPEFWSVNADWMTNLSLMVSAIVKAKDLTQSAIAAEMPLKAQDTSLCQRQRRWLMNDYIAIRDCYEPIIRPFIVAASQRTLPLILDTTDAGRDCHLLTASIGYYHRALPVAWVGGEGSRGHTGADTQGDLLTYTQTLIPADADVVVLGDGEFSSVETLTSYTAMDWHYVVRVACDTYITTANEMVRIDQLGVQSGDVLWLEDVYLTQAHTFGPLNLLVTWDDKRNQLLPLVTDLALPDEVQAWYPKRFWTEPLYGDCKGHGFDFQSSRLCHPERLAQLMLAIALAYLWMLFLGAWAFITGNDKFVDRSDRRDRSLFTIGRQWLSRLLKLDKPLRVGFCPYPFLHAWPKAGVG